MARKGRLFKKGVAYVVERAVRKIERSQDEWAQNTMEGFRTAWSDWMNYVAPALANTVARLPRKTNDPRLNVINRVIPVAMLMSNASQSYRRMRMTTPAMVPTPVQVQVRTPG